MRRTAWSAALLLPFTACRVSYSALDTASPEATRITNLHWLLFWVTGAVSFAVIGALAIALTRFSRADNDQYLFQDPGTPTLNNNTSYCAHCHVTINADYHT